jgi:hypothetical protein
MFHFVAQWLSFNCHGFSCVVTDWSRGGLNQHYLEEQLSPAEHLLGEWSYLVCHELPQGPQHPGQYKIIHRYLPSLSPLRLGFQ